MRAISFTHIKSSFFTHKDLLLANRDSMWTITTCPMGSVRTISIQLHLSLCRNCIVLWQVSICNTNYQLLFSLIKTSQKLRNCPNSRYSRIVKFVRFGQPPLFWSGTMNQCSDSELHCHLRVFS